MQVRLLGPVELWNGSTSVPIGPRARAVLAMLALDPGRVHSVDRLIEAVWGPQAPTTAVAQIQACVSELRRAWAAAEPGGSVWEVIVTATPGYVLRTEQVDVLEFERRVAAARDAQPAAAAEELRAALGLWRGPALGGLPGLAVEATRLEERRLAALEARIEADLRAGRHGELISELASIVSAYPLRERFRGQLMLALHRAGRRSEALDAYRDARRTLVEELGLEPGPELRRIQRAILADDALSGAPPSGIAGSSPPGGGPSPLPPDVADFTGRGKEVAAVLDAVSRRSEPYGAVPIVTVTGGGGVGKTILAVHAAHRLRGRFPDGQMFIDLHGTATEPATPADALGRLLRRLGVEDAALPEDPEERAELYRARLDGRRVLIVLDDAAAESQVRPLLPGSPTCGVIVTARGRLTGLAGAVGVELGSFEPGQAAELLTRVVGAERVAAEVEAAERIARLCEHLPLALRICAARLAAKPHWTLERLAWRLADERHRLDELVHADLDVRERLEPSHRGLSPAAQRVFGLLSLLDVPDFCAWVAAALLDVPASYGEDLVEELVDARLLEVAGRAGTRQPRYRFPGLLRVYARERLLAEESTAARRSALGRALSAWLGLLDEAGRRLPHPCYAPLTGGAPRRRPSAATAAALLTDPMAWFEGERAAITELVRQAREWGLHRLGCDLAAAGLPFFELCGRVVDWRRCGEEALAAAREAGDLRGEASALVNLGSLLSRQSRFAEARRRFERAAGLYERIGAGYGRAGALCGVAATFRLSGDPAAARPLWSAALRLFEGLGDPRAEAYATEGLGLCDLDQGAADAARARFEEMLRLHHAAGNTMGQAHALRRLAAVELAVGAHAEALDLLGRALPAFQAAGDRLSEAVVHMRMGECLVRQGGHDQADRLLDRAMTRFRDVGWRTCEGYVLRLRGEMLLAGGDAHAAMGPLGESLRIFRDLDESPGLAETLRCVAEARAATGEDEAARGARDEARAILAELGRES